MSNEVSAALVSAIITSIITIIGFIVTYKMNKRNYKEELNNSKTTLNIEKLQSIILDVSNLMNNPNNISVDTYQELVSKILSYGSLDSIKILTHMQTTLYNRNNDETSGKKFSDKENQDYTVFTLSCYSMLIAQIKYDLTGEIIPPLTYAKIKLTDFSKLENEFYIKINTIIDELNLNEKFKNL
jgi:hypothetical protein